MRDGAETRGTRAGSPRRRLAPVLAAISLLVAAAAAPAQPPDPATRQKRDQLERSVLEAFGQRDLDRAEALLREWIALRPMEFVPVYNLACVLSLKGQTADAAQSLLDAVSLGFTDRRQIERDTNLLAVRDTEEYRGLLANWPAVLDRVIDTRLDRARAGFSKQYTFDRDGELRLAFASGFDPGEFARAREEIKHLAAWWQSQVLPEGTPAVVAGGDAPDPWVMVILPTKQDFTAWAARNFPRRDGANSRIGGVYDNDKKELVSGDLGASFRHEFMHVLHWRHNARMGQTHALWVQEGLCSLVEDVRMDAGGAVVPIVSWRTNSLKKRAAGTRISIEALIALPPAKFSSVPLANYATARAIFLYLSELGKLRAWYGEYCDGFGADPTGRAALEQVLGKPIKDIDRDFRKWLMKLPDAPQDGPDE